MALAKKVEPQLTDIQKLELELSGITDPRAMLQALVDNAEYIGSDPYYADLNDTIWKHVARVLGQK